MKTVMILIKDASMNIFIVSLIGILFLIGLFKYREKQIYLINFTVFETPEDLKVTHDTFMERTAKIESFDQSSIDFQKRLLKSSSIGDESCFPPGILYTTTITTISHHDYNYF